jgi:hypothetical protein
MGMVRIFLKACNLLPCGGGGGGCRYPFNLVKRYPGRGRSGLKLWVMVLYRGRGERPFKGILGNNTKTGRESR